MGRKNIFFKKVLITQNSLKPFAGSEIVTLELATFFQQNGADVTVFTWYYSEPIKSEFKKRGINVVTDEDDPAIEKEFDLIWVNHQVLPIKIIQNLNAKPQPIFIFYHMSYMDKLYLEQPYIYSLEEKIGAISLFVSDEVLQMNLKKYGNIFHNPTIFPNWSPSEFHSPTKKSPTNQKILIVSNHPPIEVEQAKQLLESSGFLVEYIGHAKKKYSLINPEILTKYSCVISIGKTVQYCLTLDIPVYVYDHFGGCGFLNKENYKKAKSKNFSGRGFAKKTPEEIAKEIADKRNEAQIFQTSNLNEFKNEFSFENNLKKILHDTILHKIEKLESSYINYVIGAETIAKEKVVAENKTFILQDEQKEQSDIIKSLTSENENLKKSINLLENSRIVKLDKKIRHFITTKKKS